MTRIWILFQQYFEAVKSYLEKLHKKQMQEVQININEKTIKIIYENLLTGIRKSSEFK